MSQTEAQKRAIAAYRKKSVKTLNVKFFPADEELYEHVQSKKGGEGANAYVKRLIREDIEREKVKGSEPA